MRLDSLTLSNVRNYAHLELQPQPGLNVFVGPNAQGKSNLLEAISVLGTGKSFRTSRERDLIRDGFELATISGEAHVRAGAIRLGCTLTATARGSRKLYTVNGRSVRYATFLGSLRIVSFVPADLHLVDGPPSVRRSFLNGALAQEQKSYYRDLARYQKALSQKSALLRSDGPPDPDLLKVYDQTLVSAGTALMIARNHFIRTLAIDAAKAHARWSDRQERLELTYRPNIPFEAETEDLIAASFEAALCTGAEQERLRRSALFGPHRDDIALDLDGRSLAAFGSQGQQRTAVLAVKVAEYSVMHERSGEAPLLLLDDVLSELDRERARAFLDGVGAFEQAFITATQFPDALPAGFVYEIEGARILAMAH